MKNNFTLKTPGFIKTAVFALACLLLPGMLNAQLTGTRNIPGDYATLAAAITDLNTQGVGAGGVTINLIAGNPQTAPAGGYQITASGTLADPIIIQGNANVILAFTPQAAASFTDAIFKIVGGDFIAINGFVMQENPGNTITAAATNTMTEWGVALLYGSATNGAQNNAIAGNTISLNRSYTNSWAVYSNTRHTATAVTVTADITAPSGSNSGNRVYGNIISNVNYAIAFIGSSTAANMDIGNDVGGTSALTGNTITNWGGAPSATSFISNSGTLYCIFMNHQIGDNISFNSITSAAVSGATVAFRGIFKDYTVAAPTGTFTVNINNNNLTLTSGNASGALEHIRSQGMGTLSTATININNNTIVGSAITAAGSTSTMNGIINSSAAGVLSVNGNIIRNLSTTAVSGTITIISNTASVVTSASVSNNQLGNASGGLITYTVANSGILNTIICAGSATSTVTVSNNDIRGITHTVAVSGAHNYITVSGSTGVTNVNNNTFTALNVNTTGAATFFVAGATMTATGSQTF
ncbi:MAG: beta strand repeat-containing protein, partial [Bacteroidia bacterium]